MGFLQGPINFIDDQLYSTCSRPFSIYVRTAIPAFIDAWLLVRILQWDDIVRDRAAGIVKDGGIDRPRGRHTKRSRGRAPPQGKRTYRSANGLDHLLRWTQPLELIGFAMLMYGAVDNFYHDWQHYLDLAQACENQRDFGPLIRARTNGQAFPNAGGNALQMTELVQPVSGWSSNNFGVTVPIGFYRVTFAATIKGPNGSASYALEIRGTAPGNQGGAVGEFVETTPGQETDLFVVANIWAPLLTGGRIAWLIRGNPVPIGLEVVKADVVVYRTSAV